MKKGGRSTVKELLLELAEAVQHAVAELVEDPAEVVGRGGHGARLNGRPIRVHAYNPKDLLFTVYLGSNAHPDAARVAGLARRVRNLGAASLDLCLVARGAADLYYMHSAVANTKLRAVDIA